MNRFRIQIQIHPESCSSIWYQNVWLLFSSFFFFTTSKLGIWCDALHIKYEHT